MDQEDPSKEQIVKLRQLVTDLNSNLTDFDLLRWLQEYNFDVEQCASKLQSHLRLLNAWDSKKFQVHPIVDKYFPCGLVGPTGKDGNLLVIDCLGRVDGDGMIKCASSTQFIRTRMVYMEHILHALREQEEKLGKQVKMVVVYDLENMEYSKALVNFATGRFKNYGNFMLKHYPGLLQKLIAVNVPNFMSYIFTILQPFFPESLAQSGFILSNEWKTEILEHVDPSALPIHWGGTMVDENSDPMCQTKIVVPPSKVPEEFFWSPEKAKFADEELSELSVMAGTFEYITMEVETPDTNLEWYFMTDNGWAFGVYFTKDEDETDSEKMEMVFPDFGTFQFKTEVPENDTIVCNKPGFYKLKFCNQHAWWTTLNVKFKISLT